MLRWTWYTDALLSLKHNMSLIDYNEAVTKSISNICFITYIFTLTCFKAIGGMRGIKGMLWDTSLLDPEEVILYHSDGFNMPFFLIFL